MNRVPLPSSLTPLERTRLRAVGLKQAARNRKLAKIKRELIAELGMYCRFGGTAAHAADVLDLHHVVQRSLGGGDERTNLVLLCREHHEWVHHNIRQATELGFLRPGLPLSHVEVQR